MSCVACCQVAVGKAGRYSHESTLRPHAGSKQLLLLLLLLVRYIHRHPFLPRATAKQPALLMLCSTSDMCGPGP